MTKAIDPAFSLAEVQKVLGYDIGTGIFTWKVARTANTKVGDIAGHYSKRNYVRMWLLGDYVFAHRLAWFYVHGRWPVGGLDHINGNSLDNRICNLREVTQAQNLWNAKKSSRNKSGVKGVSYAKAEGNWKASLRAAPYKFQVTCKTFEEAVAARRQLELKYHGEFRHEGE